jgi:glycosyltransferase involved in cell wall biosynthesis
MNGGVQQIGIWFPAVRTGTGTDVFTERLADALERRGIRAEIDWLPLRAEYAPWSVPIPRPPKWATVVHINSWLHRRFIPANLSLVTTVHGCVHDPAFTPYKTLPRAIYHRLWIKPCEAHCIQRADIVTAVSQYTADHTTAIFGRKDIAVLYNWIDTDTFCPDARPHPHQPFRLLFVGKPSLRKGADLLPRIMQILGRGFELRYTGAPQDITVPDLPENMVAIGRLSGDAAVVEAYREADALLFPSRLEGLSLAMLEAQSCGLPIIATRASSLPEVVEHQQTGILCPANQPEAFAEAVRKLRDPSEWSRLATASRARATTLFGEESLVSAWIKLYQGLNRHRKDIRGMTHLPTP